jgi:hypothetical protein
VANDQHETCIRLFDFRNAFIVDPSWMDESRKPRRQREYVGWRFGTLGTANPIGTNTPPARPIPCAGASGEFTPSTKAFGARRAATIDRLPGWRNR